MPSRRKKPTRAKAKTELAHRAQGEALRLARQRKELDVMAVVEALREAGLSKGQSEGTYRTWESGRFSPPAHVLAFLCRLYDTTPNDVLGFPHQSRITLIDTRIERALRENPRRYSLTERRRMFAKLMLTLSPDTEIVWDEASSDLDARIAKIEAALGLL